MKDYSFEEPFEKYPLAMAYVPWQHFTQMYENLEKGYSSMYQDVTRGIPTEIDAINGAIVQQAKLYNVPAPYKTLIVDLIHAIEGAYRYQKD